MKIIKIKIKLNIKNACKNIYKNTRLLLVLYAPSAVEIGSILGEFVYVVTGDRTGASVRYCNDY